MENQKPRFSSIDEYIASFPAPVQTILGELRMVIRAVAPEAQEKISYQMPTFVLNGYLVHFAAYEKHIGLYPAPDGSQPFMKELSRYKVQKSTFRFPIDRPLPMEAIREYIKFRVVENLGKVEIQTK